MGVKSKVLVLAGLLAVLLIGSFLGYRWLTNSNTPSNISTVTSSPEKSVPSSPDDKKSKAPDFTVVNKDKKKVQLKDFVGSPVVLNFWASWCGPCQSEMPDFQKAYEKAGGKVVFMMVNLTDGDRETMESANSFIQKKKYTFPVYFDIDLDATMAYGIRSIPTTYFIDKDGYIVSVANGIIDPAALEKGLGMIEDKE